MYVTKQKCGEFMKGNAFLKRLMFQLDFLSTEEQDAVLNFYRKKIAEADEGMEEALVKTFGSPDFIAQKLKDAYLQRNAELGLNPSEKLPEENKEAAESISEEASEAQTDKESAAEEPPLDSPSSEEVLESSDQVQDPIVSEESCSEEEESPDENSDAVAEDSGENDELIFSKPSVPEKAPELIQSLENTESKTLYGEKVVREDDALADREESPEPMDLANGLTEDEIEKAKAETLIKASHYTTAPLNRLTEEEDSSFSPEADSTPSEAASELYYTDEDGDYYDSAENSFVTENDFSQESDSGFESFPQRVPGVFDKMLSSTSLPSGAKLAIKIFLSLLLLPLLLPIFGVTLVLYACFSVFTVSVAVLLFAAVAVLIVIGIIELVYGFTMLFDTVSVALIELGVGTALFALVVGVTALIYEFLFGTVPLVIKTLAKLLVLVLKRICRFLYGGKA